MMTNTFRKFLLAGLSLVLFFAAVEAKATTCQVLANGSSTSFNVNPGTSVTFTLQCQSVAGGAWTNITDPLIIWYNNGAWYSQAASVTISAPSSGSSWTVKGSYGGANPTITLGINKTLSQLTFAPVTASNYYLYNGVYYIKNKSISHTVTASFSDGTSSDVTSSAIYSAIYSGITYSCGTAIAGVGAKITCAGVLDSSGLTNDAQIKIQAKYTYNSTTFTNTANVFVRKKWPSNSSIVGASQVNESLASAGQYNLNVTWSDTTSTQFSPASGWSLTDTTYATISAAGALTTKLLITQGAVVNKITYVKLAAYSLLSYSASYPETVTPSQYGVTIKDLLFLGSIEVVGPSSVDENKNASYTANAIYDNGTKSYGVNASWRVLFNSLPDATYATIAGGLLTAKEVAQDTTITAEATYTQNVNGFAETKIGSTPVTIKDLSGLSRLDIALASAPTMPITTASMNENSSLSFVALATMTNNSVVQVNVNWSVTSLYASVAATSGLLSSVAVTQEQRAMLMASYTLQGVTKTVTIPVTIVDTGKALVSLQIDGPATVTEGVSTSFTARATYDDNTSAVVAATWAENSAAATVSTAGAVLAPAGSVSGDQTFFLSARYTEGNVVRYAKRALTLVDADPDYGVTWRASVDTAGVQANAASSTPALSSDGRYAAFDSVATNLVADSNGVADVFVRDRQNNTTERVSVASTGNQANGASQRPAMSANGQWVAFESLASNLAANDANMVQDIFVRDRVAAVTERVSVRSDGTQANGASRAASISDDGRYVVFESDASNLVDGDNNNVSDVFIHDRSTHTTNVVRLGNFMGNGASRSPVISGNGAFVAFATDAKNFVYGDNNGTADIYVYERVAGTLSRVSLDSLGNELSGNAENPSISADGRYVTFELRFVDPTTKVATGRTAVFVRDRLNGVTKQLTVSGNDYTGDMRAPHLSSEGRFVTFEHYVSGAGAANGHWDVSMYDMRLGAARRLAVNASGELGNGESVQAVVSTNGGFVAFRSLASNLVTGDTNSVADVFVRQLPAARDAGRLWLQPQARVVNPTGQVVVDLMMDVGTNATLGGGLELMYDASLLNYSSFVSDSALGDDAAFRNFVAPVIAADGTLQNGKISFGEFNGLSGQRRVGTLTFTPKTPTTTGMALLALNNNVNPYGDFYSAVSYLNQPVGFEGTAVQIGVDTDGDGVLDSQDAFPNDPTEWADTDGDGIGNNREALLGTNPNNADTDGDGIGDSVELSLGLNPLLVDSDGDGISDLAEMTLNQNPNAIDTDGDGVPDNADAFPTLASEWSDFDHDGIGDNADTDDDNDGMPDTWETANGLNPLDASDADLDPDADGITNLHEYMWGSNPNVNNTGNGASDIKLKWAKTLGGAGAYTEEGVHTVVDGQGNVYVTGVFYDTMDFDPSSTVDTKAAYGNGDIFVSKYAADGSYLWTKVMGGSGFDAGFGVGVDGANNVYVYGVFSGTVDFDPNAGVQTLTATATGNLFVTKLTPDGNYVWSRFVEGFDDESWGRNLAVDSTGNVYVTALNPAQFVTKINSNGTQGWIYQIATGVGYNEAHGVALDGAGNVYVSGTLGVSTDFLPLSAPKTGRNAFVMRLNPVDGSRVWVRTADAVSEGEALEVRGNDVYLGGNFYGDVDFNSTPAIDDVQHTRMWRGFVSKYDVNGTYVWTRTMGDYVYGIGADSKGDVYITGDFRGTSLFDSKDGNDSYSAQYGDDIFITKYLANGDYAWTEVLPSPTGFAHAASLSVSSDDQIYMTGYFSGDMDFDPTDTLDSRAAQGGGDIFVMKLGKASEKGTYQYVSTDSLGDTGRDYGNDLAIDSSDNVYVVGSFTAQIDVDPSAGVQMRASNGGSDMYLMRRNANGSYAWVRTFGGTGNDNAVSVAVDNTGGVYVTGTYQGTVDFDLQSTVTDATRTAVGGDDIFVVKYDANGNFVWVRTFGNASNPTEYVKGVAVDGNGGVYVAGTFYGSMNFAPWTATGDTKSAYPGGTGAFVMRLDSSGNYGWTRTWDSNYTGGDVHGETMTADSAGNVYVGGYFMKRTDFNPTGGGAVYSTGCSSYIVCSVGYVAQYHADGSFGWARVFAKPSTETYIRSTVDTVAEDGVGNLYVTGSGLGVVVFDAPTNNQYSFANTGYYLTSLSTSGLFGWNQILATATTGLYAKGQDVILTGGFSGTVDFDPGVAVDSRTSLTSDADVFVTRFNPAGGYEQTITLQGNRIDVGNALGVDSQHNLYICGTYGWIYNGNGYVDFDPGAGVDQKYTAYYSDAFLSKYKFVPTP